MSNSRPDVCPYCGSEKVEEKESCDIFSCGTIIRFAPIGLEYPMGPIERSNSCYESEISILRRALELASYRVGDREDGSHPNSQGYITMVMTELECLAFMENEE